MGSFQTQWGDWDRAWNIGFGSSVYPSAAFWQSPSPVSVANTVTETNLLTGAVSVGGLTIAANYCKPGTMFRIRAHGNVSTDAVVPTLRIQAKLGSVAVVDTGAVSLGAVQLTNAGLDIEFMFGCISTGATGSFSGSGNAWVRAAVVGIGSTATSATINTTTTQALTLTATWGTASANNTLTINDVVCEVIG